MIAAFTLQIEVLCSTCGAFLSKERCKNCLNRCLKASKIISSGFQHVSRSQKAHFHFAALKCVSKGFVIKADFDSLMSA